MIYKWVVDVVVRVEVDGEEQILYQGKEFEMIEDNTYIEGAIALGWVEELKN
jgi:hypothetical protein